MKKILLITLIFICASSFAFAEDEILLDADPLEISVPYSVSLDKIAIQDVAADEPLQIYNSPIEQEQRFYSGLFKTAHDVYNLQIENTNVPSSLLAEPLTQHFEKGPLESLHNWGVVQMNMNTNFPENEAVQKHFNVGLINTLTDGTFRGGKEDFRIMLDMTPQHNRPFMQQFVQDLYIQTHRIPHHTLMVGNSRPGVGYEGAQSPYTLPFINRSQISRNLANVRKFGVRLKGNYSLVDYDLGGYSSDTFFSSFFPGVEFDGWVNLKPLGKTDGRYGKLTTGAGIVSGERNSTDFFTFGAYVGYEYKKAWMRAEYANSDGSNGGGGLTNKKAQGWYVTLGYHLTPKLELLARYDEFDPNKNISNNNQREYSAGINYYIKGQALKLILNYVFCQNDSKSDSHRIVVGTQIAL